MYIKLRNKLAVVVILSLLIASLLPMGSVFAESSGIKNVILLIPDGMNVSAVTLARWYQDGEPLAMDELACGLVRTYNSNTPIADSAPAGSAMATGYKSESPFIATMPSTSGMPGTIPVYEEDMKKPAATVLEAAKLKGMATGIVSTSNVQHATPADFTSHYPDRNAYEILAEQQVYQNIDVVLGAGSQYLDAANRKDKEDLIQVIREMGYDYVTSKAQMKASNSSKIWGMFASSAMAYEFDRDAAVEPSLAEMTQKAIEVLSKNKKGFFLMVEGSKIDWAAHANDPIGVISDVLAYDAAVKVALDYAKENGDTIVISVSDHGTGGLSIGDASTSKGYDKIPLSEFISPLKKAVLTGEGLESKFNADRSNIVEVMDAYYGITDLTEEEIRAIKETKAGSMNYTVGPMISKRAHIGWTTTGHTGEEVVLYVYSPDGDRPTGVIENTDIANYIERKLKLNLAEANSKLFVAARNAFEAKGASVQWNNDDPENPVIIVMKDENVLKLPVYKNIAELNGEVVIMNGLTLFNGEKVFVPQEAVDLIK
ncbi:MAG: Alkaline phosphatase [Firmicutes bacterium]|nr:Alkaline phosphatase [Bacillota bacterium]MDI6705504.1 alkaline phosphatase [Bacillota bacterium]